MANFAFANFGESALANSITATATSLSINTSDSPKFPKPSGSEVARVVLFDGTNEPEIVQYDVNTTVTSGTFSVTRAQEGSAAISWPAGTKVRATITAEMMDTFVGNVVGGPFLLATSATDLTDSRILTASDGIKFNFTTSTLNISVGTSTQSGLGFTATQIRLDFTTLATATGELLTATQDLVAYWDITTSQPQQELPVNLGLARNVGPFIMAATTASELGSQRNLVATQGIMATDAGDLSTFTLKLNVPQLVTGDVVTATEDLMILWDLTTSQATKRSLRDIAQTNGVFVFVTGQTLATTDGTTNIPFNGKSYDTFGTDSFATSEPTRVTVPSDKGINWVDLAATVTFNSAVVGRAVDFLLLFARNGTADSDLAGAKFGFSTAIQHLAGNKVIHAYSGMVPTVSGDFYEVQSIYNGSTDVEVLDRTFFAVRFYQ